MTRYTINLSRARMAGRKKRAKKAMSILREELEDREGNIKISGDINAEIWKHGAKNPPAKVTVEIVEEGMEKEAVLATPGAGKEEAEEETDTTTSEATESEEDYDEIVSGTVSEAKDQIRDLEDPDYEALLEAEKSNKDRKTLKEFVENRME